MCLNKKAILAALLPFLFGSLLLFYIYYTVDFFPYGFDSTLHKYLSKSFFLHLFSEKSYPDWEPFFLKHTGASVFRFIAPLPFLVSGIFYFFSISDVISLKLTVVLFTLIGAIGIKKWFKVSGFPYSNLAVFLFFTSPILFFFTRYIFFLHNICAVCLLPWNFAYFKKIEKTQTVSILAGITLALTILTHAQTAFVLILFFLLTALINSITKKSCVYLKAPLIIICAALMFAAPYILPIMLTAKDFGDYHLRDNKKYEQNSIFFYFDELGFEDSNLLKPKIPPLAELLDPIETRHLFAHYFWVVTGWLFVSLIGFRLHPLKREVLPFLIFGVVSILLGYSFFYRLLSVVKLSTIVEFPWKWSFVILVLFLPLLTGLAFAKKHIMLALLLLIIPFFSSAIAFNKADYLAQDEQYPHLVLRILLSYIPKHRIEAEHTVENYEKIVQSSGKHFLDGTYGERMADVFPTYTMMAFTEQLDEVEKSNPNCGNPLLKYLSDSPYIKKDITIDRPSTSYAGATYEFSGNTKDTEFVITCNFDDYWHFEADGTEIPLTHIRGFIRGTLPANTKHGRLYRVSPKGRNLGWGLSFLSLLFALIHRLKNKKQKATLSPVPA